MKSAYPLVLTLLLAAPLHAAEPPKLEPLPEAPPPPTVTQGKEAEPEVTITTRGEDKIEEYRIAGKLYMVKVTPAGGKPYYLIDHRGNGVFSRYDAGDRAISVPQWVLFTW